MSKNVVVIFTENNARIKVNPPDIGTLSMLDNCVINPDLQYVKGVSPHHWKRVGQKIVPMNSIERVFRDRDIERRGAINDIYSKEWKPSLLVKIIGAIIALFGIFLWKRK